MSGYAIANPTYEDIKGFCKAASLEEIRKHKLVLTSGEFFVVTAQAGGQGIDVCVEDETVWSIQKRIAILFAVTVPTVSEHLGNIYQQEELTREATIRKFRTVRREGGREVRREWCPIRPGLFLSPFGGAHGRTRRR